MQCQCGTQILGGSFCTNCGRPIQAVRETFNPTPFQPPIPPMQQQSNSNVFSIVGMSLGGVALLIFPILFGPAAIGFSIAAMTKKEKLGGLALGISIGGFFLGMIFGILFWSESYYW
jgi:hypothetical protein